MFAVKKPVLTELSPLFERRPLHQDTQGINLQTETSLITGLRSQNGGTPKGECHSITPRWNQGSKTDEC